MSNLKNESSAKVQAKYKELIPQRRFAELAHLIKDSKTEPADFVVRMGYQNYIDEKHSNKVKLFFIMQLKDITNIQPDSTILKAACEIALDMNHSEVLVSLVKRLGVEQSFFKEMSATLQKHYANYVDEGKFVDLSILMEITGVLPQEEMIHKGYRSYLEDCKFISFSGLKKRTGIKPDEEMIQEMYKQYQGQYLLHINKKDTETAESWLNRIKKLERLSKIKAKNLVIDKQES